MELQKERVHLEYNVIKYSKLCVSLAVDSFGFLSYILIGVGEVTDVVWAPLAATANYLMHADKKKGFFKSKHSWRTMIEEFLPFTDIVPSVSISWYGKYVTNGDDELRKFIQSKRQEMSVLNDEWEKGLEKSLPPAASNGT